MLDRLDKIKGLMLTVQPDGALYVLPDMSAFNQGGDKELCLHLLKSHNLDLPPGSSFCAPDTVHISYTTSMEELGTAMDKLQDFLFGTWSD